MKNGIYLLLAALVLLLLQAEGASGSLDETTAKTKSSFNEIVGKGEKAITEAFGTKTKSAVQSIAIAAVWWFTNGPIYGVGAGAISHLLFDPERTRAALLWLMLLGFMWRDAKYRVILIGLAVLSYVTKLGGI